MASSQFFVSNLVSSSQSRGTSEERIFQVIRQVVLAKMRPSTASDFQEATEVVSATIAAVFQAFNKKRESRISNREAYARRVACHEVSQHLAKKYPNRIRVLAKIGAIVSQSPRLEIRKHGKMATKHIETKAVTESEIQSSIAETGPTKLSEMDSNFVESVLDSLGGSMPLYQFASLIQSLLDLDDQHTLGLDATQNLSIQTQIDQEFEAKSQLRDLWNCILSLSMEHRRALLLNLRDFSGKCDVQLLVDSGAVQHGELAEALDWPQSDLPQLFKLLPMSDEDVSSLMKIEVNKVFGLRFAARRALKKKMATLGWIL